MGYAIYDPQPLRRDEALLRLLWSAPRARPSRGEAHRMGVGWTLGTPRKPRPRRRRPRGRCGA